jgi:hypothetical protein
MPDAHHGWSFAEVSGLQQGLRGMFGILEISSTLPCSTTLPIYITTISSAMLAMTPDYV